MRWALAGAAAALLACRPSAAPPAPTAAIAVKPAPADDLMGSATADLPPAGLPADARLEPPRVVYERALDLFAAYQSGAGRLLGTPATPGDGSAGTVPWVVAPGRESGAHASVWARSAGAEGGLGIALEPGTRWCVDVDVAPGSRLRFEAVASGGGGVTVRGPGLPEQRVEGRPEPAAEAHSDLPVAGAGELCLSAAASRVTLLEPRLLSPAKAADARPRWVALVQFDALRADAVTADDAPALWGLAASGRVYADALSSGSHTNSGLWPMLAGRDLMRIAPLFRLTGARWSSREPAARVLYRRPNVFLPHLMEETGYHSVMLGNNAYVSGKAMFAREFVTDSPLTGTLDTARRLPSLLRRYADERVFLLYCITATHPQHATPRRLEEELGCSRLGGLARSACRYRARVRHGDEALGALLDGLRGAGRRDDTLLVATADHAELFEDGWPLEGQTYSPWRRLDHSHGYTVDRPALHVPLVVAGPSIARARIPETVSTVGVVPWLARHLGLSAPLQFDAPPLPDAPGGPAAPPPFAYGFCAHAQVLPEGERVWWDLSTCGERRLAGSREPALGAFEKWVARRRVPFAPGELARFQADNARWVADHVPRRTMMLRLASAEPFVAETDGRWLDYGPVGVRGFSGVRATVDGSRITVSPAGYRGLFSLTPSAGSRVRLRRADGSALPLALGAQGLPLAAAEGWIEPGESLFVGPPAAPAPAAILEAWWEDPASSGRDETGTTTGIERVLREWGYIR